MSEGTGKYLDRNPDDLYLTWDRIYRSEAKKAAEYRTPHVILLTAIISGFSPRRLFAGCRTKRSYFLLRKTTTQERV